MEVSVKAVEGGYLVAATLTLKDGEDTATLEAKMTIPHGEVLETLTDPSNTRSVAAKLVGRMTTAWKLGLITTVGEGVVAALRGAVSGSLASGTPED